MWWWLTTKKFLTFGMWTYHEPFKTYDYFEPREEGRFYEFPTNNNVAVWIDTDNRKSWPWG